LAPTTCHKTRSPHHRESVVMRPTMAPEPVRGPPRKVPATDGIIRSHAPEVTRHRCTSERASTKGLDWIDGPEPAARERYPRPSPKSRAGRSGPPRRPGADAASCGHDLSYAGSPPRQDQKMEFQLRGLPRSSTTSVGVPGGST